MAKSTSFRISEEARQRLADRAAREGISSTALLDRLIREGVDALDHPGVVFRGPTHGRRAALSGGPDVWEIVGRLQELDGSLQERVKTLTEEMELHERSIRVAVDYAAEHTEEIQAQVDLNREMAARSQRAAKAREALIA